MRDDFLAGAAEVLDGLAELGQRRLSAGGHVVEVEDHGLDPRVLLGRLQRVDQVPEQGFGLARALHALDGLFEGIAGELLDDFTARGDDQRGAILDTRYRGTQGSDDESEDDEQQYQVQELAQPVEAEP